MKKDPDKNARLNRKIRDEIRKRVFEESLNQKQEQADITDEQIEIDALSEVSGLPEDDIKRISDEVKAKYDKKSADREKSGHLISIHPLRLIVIIAIAGIIATSVFFIVSQNIRKEAEKKRKELYYGLFKAIDEGNLNLVEYFISQGSPVQMPESPYEGYLSALIAAANKENIPIVRLLLKHGADVRIRMKTSHWTALDYADHRQNPALIKILGQAMADAYPEQSPVRKLWEKSIPFTCYAFVEQIKQNNSETARLFLEAGMNMNVEGRYDTYENYSALVVACRIGNYEMIKMILGFAGPENLPQLYMPLQTAVNNKHKIDIIRLLLEAGADPNAVNILEAMYDQEIAELLLKYGLDINAPTGRNQVPALIMVLDTWEIRVDDATRKKWVRFLLDHGADVNNRGGGLYTALKMAEKWGNREVIEWIINAGPADYESE